MPLIKIQTSLVSPDDDTVNQLLQTLSAKLAKHLGKPESYVMTALESGIKMTFAGTFEPVCYVEIKSVGSISAAQTKSMSSDFCQEIEACLGMPKNRIYIEFSESKGYLWGWNSSTFG
jgi:phenylpyruvate tautomerase PptA (4-oxalocrotonate tautomerase family)